MRVLLLYNMVDDPEKVKEGHSVSDNDIINTVGSVLGSVGQDFEIIPLNFSSDLIGKLKRDSADIVLNLCESFQGDPSGESWIAAYFELMGMPYTGSGPLTLSLCLDKARTKQVLRANNLPSPDYQVFHATSQKLDPRLRFPLIVKPLHEDASIGIDKGSVVHNKLELFKRIDHIIETFEQPAIVEEFIDGREINAAIIGNGSDIMVLPLSEILFEMDPTSPNIVDFDAKWTEGSKSYEGTKGVCPADLPKNIEILTISVARDAYRALGLKDYGRVDIRIRDGKPYIIEVNPNPGIGEDSGFFRSCRQMDMSYAEMIERILSKAVTRYGLKPQPRKKPKIFDSRKGGLIFREVGLEDIETILGWMNDPVIARTMDEPEIRLTREDLVLNMLLNDNDLDMIVETQGGKRIGFGSIYDISKWNRTCEISFLIGEKDQRGKGLGGIMVEGILRLCKDRIKARRVIARVVKENERSLRILGSSGFRRVGELRGSHILNGIEMNEILLELVFDRDHPTVSTG